MKLDNPFQTVSLSELSVVGGLSEGFRFYKQPHHFSELGATAAATHAFKAPGSLGVGDPLLRDMREAAEAEAKRLDPIADRDSATPPQP